MPGMLMRVDCDYPALTCSTLSGWWDFHPTLNLGEFVVILDEGHRMDSGGYVVKAITSHGVTWVDRGSLEECG